ncbi:MAG: hypothetical protein HY744_02850 [Deltaproteobacteria bacterium]|nr:hypothetical protein [Deltaproteobacteria bacterium]
MPLRAFPRRCFVLGAGMLCVLGADPALGAKPDAPGKAYSYRRPTPGSDLETGGATIAVRAPLATVRQALLDYGRYKEILPRLSQSRVVARRGDEAEVYLRAPILRGVAHIWGLVRFSAPEKVGRSYVITGRLLKGNLDAWWGRWRLLECGKNRTLVNFEQFIELKIPLPASLVAPELEWATRKAVTTIRDTVECAGYERRRPIPAPAEPPPG